MGVKDITQEQFDELIDSHPLVIVDFWAEWCVPCVSFGKSFAETAVNYPDVLFCKINVDSNEELVGNLSIKTIPTVIIIKQGTIIYKEGGTMPKKALSDLLDKALDIKI